VIIWAKQEEAIASTSDRNCLRPCILMSFLYNTPQCRASLHTV